ncbi:uncharacterized protein LOC111308084 [Durio zibethinus]|uniref:Uncharacterized protein LOC111308084 n=1 Tax=Durio zibethinus TaxID=66656 RepID=A0A6P6AB77_DURZI|nr:uncharacterized protein LOC111308084 [Durio zibethinus]
MDGVLKRPVWWSKDKFNGDHKEIEALNKDLIELKANGGDEMSNSHEEYIKQRLNELLEKEETFWLQRSRINWLRERDRNTAFFHHRLYKMMNNFLLTEFIAEDMYDVVKQIHPTKAPRSDGRLDDINNTNIVLIPKVKDPKSMSQFRPISICNVIYKIIAKTLAKRLKHILPSLVSENQSAFVPRRLITDNVLIAYGILHILKLKKKGKEGWGAVKLDISKAYDWIERSFLKIMMERLGFSEKWVSIIMRCISSFTYRVILNGTVTNLIHPEKAGGNLKGFRASVNGPRINHLFFTGNSLLFIKANQRECERVKRLLKIYEDGSRQTIIYDKPVCFSAETLEMI